jgi:hypothetical protein
MAFLFSAGGPQVGAVRAPARMAGMTAWVVPGAAPAADIPILLPIVFGLALVPRLPARLASSAIGNPVARGRGRAQRDHGRFSA